MSNTLGLALKQYYRINSVGVRTLALEWGCSPATVSRFLNGKAVDMSTFLRIITTLTKEQK